MNTRGLVELIVLNVGLDSGVLTVEVSRAARYRVVPSREAK